MKKRIVSFSMVLLILFSGVFSCFVSAEMSTGEKMFNGFWDFLEAGHEGLEDIFGWQNKIRQEVREELSDFIFGSEGAQDDGEIISSPDSVYDWGFLKNPCNTVNTDLDGRGWNTGYIGLLPEGALKCTIDPGAVFTINVTCFYSYEFRYQFFYSDGKRIEYGLWGKTRAREPITITNDTNNTMFLYLRYSLAISNPDPINFSTIVCTCEGTGFRWGWDTELHWQGAFEVDEINDLCITLESSRALDPNLDGDFYICAGILYKTENDATYASNHVKGKTVSTGVRWQWKFDLGELSYYLYRKRCGYDDFYGFVSVYKVSDGSFVYEKEYPLNIEPPGGIFDDVEDLPKWDDYKPEPEPLPIPPTIIFNYNPVTNNNETWESFDFNTINNYNIQGSGGGGGSGSSGDDSSQDDPGGGSSEPDPGGDSSGGDSSSEVDPGSGGGAFDESFLEWLAEALQTINDNITNAYETIDHNIGIMNDNASSFFDYCGQFLDDTLTGYLDYIASLIEKFNNDFLNWGEAFSNFTGDMGDTINHNITIVGDNIVRELKTQTVPDQDCVIEILDTHVPGFSDMKSGFEEFETTNEKLVLSVPLSGNSNTVEQNNVSGDNIQGTQTTGYDINTGEFVLDISEELADSKYDIMREFMRVFVLGLTFIGAINVFLKIFGLGFSNDDE